MTTRPPVRVCFVCLGNICRSPTAEGIMKSVVAEAGLSASFFIDSAGTGDYHVGEPADRRSAQAARDFGVELTSIARQFKPEDLDAFDYVVAMDRRNLLHLQRMAGPQQTHKLSLLRSFEPAAGAPDVPDPYFEDNFEQVFRICEAGCRGLLEHIRRERGLST